MSATSIRPNREQFIELAAAADDGPVVMLNLLKFKARADDGDRTGGDAYRRYGDQAIEMIKARGGELLRSGKAEQILIGDPNEDWDAVLLVQYPSRAAFIDMVTKPEYEKAHEHREAGLERTVVIACSPRVEALARNER